MKRILGLVAVGALTATVFATSASAQLFGVPTSISPHQGKAISIGAFYGKGLNDDSGKTDAFGGGAMFGFGGLAVGVGVATVSSDLVAGSEIAYGGLLQFSIGYNKSVAITPFVGYGRMDNNLKLNVPLGVAIGFQPEGSSFEVWTAPRATIATIDLDGAESQTGYGISGGIRYTLAMGVGFGATFDFLNIDYTGGGQKNSIMQAGLGVGYSFGGGGM